MDLKTLRNTAPVAVHLRAVDGMEGYEAGEPLYDVKGDEKTPVIIFIHHAGVNCDAFQNEKNRQDKAFPEGAKINADTARVNNARRMAAVITGWQGIDEKFSYQAAIDLLTPVESLWIWVQLNQAVIDLSKKLNPS